MEHGAPHGRPQRRACISPKWPSQSWIQNYVGKAGQEHHEKRIHQRDRKPRQPEGLPPKVVSSSSGDNPVKLRHIDDSWYHSNGKHPNAVSSSSADNPVKQWHIGDSWYHSNGKHLEATQVEPSLPSEASTGLAVSTQVWLTLLRLPAFSALCPLNEVASLSCTSRMVLEPTVAGHLAFRMDTLHSLWRMLSRRPTNPTGRHHRDQTPMQPEGPLPDVASPSSGGNPVEFEPVVVNQPWPLEQEMEPYEAVTTEDFMDQAAEQTRHWQTAGTATSSQAPRRVRNRASYLINTCLQCEVKPGIDWPLGLLCKDCYEGLSEK